MATVGVGLDVQLSIELKQQDKNRILLGRTRIDEYRASHSAMHTANQELTPETNEHWEFLYTLYSLLQQDEWFEGLDVSQTLHKCFALSDVLAARDLGYDLPIDVLESGNQDDIDDYNARWK